MLKLGDATVSKMQVLKKMRGFIEEYSFEEAMAVGAQGKQAKKGQSGQN